MHSCSPREQAERDGTPNRRQCKVWQSARQALIDKQEGRKEEQEIPKVKFAVLHQSRFPKEFVQGANKNAEDEERQKRAERAEVHVAFAENRHFKTENREQFRIKHFHEVVGRLIRLFERKQLSGNVAIRSPNVPLP